MRNSILKTDELREEVDREVRLKKTSFSIFNLQPVDGDGIKTSLLLRKERATPLYI
jgi:hypothetical protein